MHNYIENMQQNKNHQNNYLPIVCLYISITKNSLLIPKLQQTWALASVQPYLNKFNVHVTFPLTSYIFFYSMILLIRWQLSYYFHFIYSKSEFGILVGKNLKITVLTNYILCIELVRSDSFPHGIPCGGWFLFCLTPFCQELKPINLPGNQVSPLQLLRALPALLPPASIGERGEILEAVLFWSTRLFHWGYFSEYQAFSY